MKMKAEIRMKLLQSKECPRSPANHQKPGERPGTPSPSQPQEIHLANTLSLDFRPPELGSSLLLKPLSSWYFVTVAPEQRNTGQF